jgi:hypothetical protein
MHQSQFHHYQRKRNLWSWYTNEGVNLSGEVIDNLVIKASITYWTWDLFENNVQKTWEYAKIFLPPSLPVAANNPCPIFIEFKALVALDLFKLRSYSSLKLHTILF